jgi:hypothetical protein
MRCRSARAVVLLLASALLGACSGPLGKQYEYEEQIYLSVDGRATVVIDASLPALVALHRLPLDPTLRSSVDREQVRRLYATAGCEDVRVGQPWIRRGRRFVQIRVSTTDINQLSKCGPLSWSTYRMVPASETITYEQIVGSPTAGDPGAVNWDGTELVAFKLHVPSRILFHNVKRLEDGANGQAERGNILTWEQRLADRRFGQPVEMFVRMDAESILYRTLWLFAGAFGAAVLLISSLIWFTIRRAKTRKRPVGL